VTHDHARKGFGALSTPAAEISTPRAYPFAPGVTNWDNSNNPTARQWPRTVDGENLPYIVAQQTVEAQDQGEAMRLFLKKYNINPEGWDEFLRSAPESQNIEDRRTERW
jgi:hypothetical protein